MSALILHEACVRALSVNAGCVLCKEVCLYGAIDFSSHLPKIDANICTDCAICAGVCPTEAINVSNKNPASLSVEELFALGVSKKMDKIYLEGAKEEEGYLQKKADEVNNLFLIFEIQCEAVVVLTEREKLQDSSKRALFRMFTKEGAGEIDYSLLRSKKIPPKRELFLDAMAKLELQNKDAAYPLSFATDKYIDDSCDNCSLCYSVCPSGALETTAMKNAIIFSPHLCLKCKLCEDVCEKKSIASLPNLSLALFLERKKKVLKKFSAKLCPTCGAVFATDNDECPRCTKESEDAMELLGL